MNHTSLDDTDLDGSEHLPDEDADDDDHDAEDDEPTAYDGPPHDDDEVTGAPSQDPQT